MEGRALSVFFSPFERKLSAWAYREPKCTRGEGIQKKKTKLVELQNQSSPPAPDGFNSSTDAGAMFPHGRCGFGFSSGVAMRGLRTKKWLTTDFKIQTRVQSIWMEEHPRKYTTMLYTDDGNKPYNAF